MADQRKQLPLIDVAAVVLSPILIMTMLGSLVFFLIEVLYAGQYSGRLVYTFFFYVIGCVLVARISIRFGTGRAALYTAGLAGACFVAMLAFVEYPTPLTKAIGPVINIVLMVLVWWSASKLTWDCTQLEEDQKSSGRGILAAAGFDGTKSTTAAEDDEEFDPDRSTTESKKKKKGDPPLGWFERYRKYREWQKKKPHTPGVWVLYFALAAIPLFALGQSVIASDDTDRRGATFWQMAMYVGSALGLLVTTSLLGLRRYLEARNASLPTSMTAGWLGVGFAMIVLFLGCAAVLPRPHSETPLFTFSKAGKQDRSASKYAQVRDKNAGKGEGNTGTQTEKGKGNASGKNGEPGGKSGEKNSGGQNKGGSSSGKNSSDQSGRQGEQGKGSNDKSQSKGEQSKGDDSKSQDDGKSGEQGDDAEKKDDENKDGDGNSSGSSRTSQLTAGLEKVATGVKWLVWVVIAVAVVGGVIWFALKGLSPFTNWARGLLDWWRGLFGAKKKSTAAAKADEALVKTEILRPPPFSMFHNPFADGTANRREAGELTEYTYAALDSWAWDNAQGRQPEETPSEFVARLSEDSPEFQVPGQAVVKLLMRILYSPGGPLPGDAKARLEAFWNVLDSAAVAA